MSLCLYGTGRVHGDVVLKWPLLHLNDGNFGNVESLCQLLLLFSAFLNWRLIAQYGQVTWFHMFAFRRRFGHEVELLHLFVRFLLG